MRFSVNWLSEIVNSKIDDNQLLDQLTMAGLEVESFSPACRFFSGVYSAQIIEVEQHPNADKLKVCKVKFNGETLQIVCGDPKVAAGMKVALATNGATLLNNEIKIKNSKLRGVESFGMLCAKSELGLSEIKDGIWVLSPETDLDLDLYEYLKLNDKVVEISITPNRGDCFSLRGIARELAVINNFDLKLPAENTQLDQKINSPLSLKIDVQNTQSCPRYAGRVIKNINNMITTPLWMQERLRRADIKYWYPLVDITNYLMLELGQPMHAFDLDKIHGNIVVRDAKLNEKIRLLDGSEVNLTAGDLVIADDTGPIALAGIMGGESTAISPSTTNVLLESAFFTPNAIIGKARKYNIVTDAAQRFERGVDPTITCLALERATEILVNIMGGSADLQIGAISEVANADVLKDLSNRVIKLRHARIKRVLGLEIESSVVTNILTKLGLELISFNTVDQIYKWRSPTHRFDLSIEEDLIEELARIYGYNNIVNNAPSRNLILQPKQFKVSLNRSIRNVLSCRGYYEAITYSFIDNKLHADFTNAFNPIKLINPISSEMSELRQSLCPGLIKAAEYNFNHQAQVVKLYEIGKCFYSNTDGSVREENRLAGILAGHRQLENWHAKAQNLDFYDAKGDLETLFTQLNISHFSDNIRFVAPNTNNFQFCAGQHSGQTAVIMYNDKNIGWVSKLHPEVLKKTNIDNTVILFELILDEFKNQGYTSYKEVSKMPLIRRDLAFLFKADIQFQQLQDLVVSIGESLLKNISIFDVYTGEGIPDGYKSIALSVVLQHKDRTLVDDEIVTIIDKIVAEVTSKLSGKLRE